MAMNREMKSILFENTRKFVIEEGSLERPDNVVMAVSLNKNLEKYGYTLDSSSLRALATQTPSEMKKTWSDLVNIIQEVTGEKQFKNSELFYPNFPEQVMSKSDAELYLNSLFYYSFSQSNDEIMNAIANDLRKTMVGEKEDRLPLLEEFPRDLKIINKGTENDLFKMMNARIHSLNMSEHQYRELKKFSEAYQKEFDKFISSDEKFQSKETKIKIALMLHDAKRDSEVGLMLKDSVDVLRYAAMLSYRNGADQNNVELKPTDGRKIDFKLKNSEQKQIKGLLNKCKGLYTDIWRQEENFKRLMNRISPTKKGGCPERVIEAFDNLAHNHKYDEYGIRIFNFNRELDSAIKDRDPQRIELLAEKRPGDFLRCYISAVKHASQDQRDFVIEAVRACAKSDSIALKNMMTVYGKVEQEMRNQELIKNGQSAINIYSHHSGKHYVVTDTNKSPLTSNDYQKMLDVIKSTASEMVRGNQDLGNVYIDEKLKNNKAPGREVRDASGGSIMTKYSTIPTDKNKNLLIFGINWGAPVSNPNESWIDVDLSAHFYGKNYEDLGYVSYCSLRKNEAVHSGDYTNVPKDGTSTEAIIADKERLRAAGIRYVVSEVHCFSIDSFQKAGNCHFVFQEREGSFDDVGYDHYNDRFNHRKSEQLIKQGNTNKGEILLLGEVFEPSASEANILLDSKSKTAVPVVYDVEKERFYWLDYGISKSFEREGPSVTEDPKNMSAIMVEIARAQDNPYPDMKTLFEVFAEGNGKIVDSPEKADTVFVSKPVDREELGIPEESRVITAFDLDVISDEFSGNKEVINKEEQDIQRETSFEEPALVKQLRFLKEKTNGPIIRDIPEIDINDIDSRDFN